MADGSVVAVKAGNAAGAKGPCCRQSGSNKGGRDGMKKPSISLQDLRRRIYVKAKADTQHRFWGLYVHVCKMETLREAYRAAKANNGAPGIDGVTFGAVEEAGVEPFIERIRDELVSGTYRPLRNRNKEIPKGDGRTRTLGIPAIRDRVVQGALKLILEPVFGADFQDGSYGYRPKRTAHEAVHRVATAIARGHTRVIDADLKAYFDTIRHDILPRKVAARVDDDHYALKTGKVRVAMGGPLSGAHKPGKAKLAAREKIKARIAGIADAIREGWSARMKGVDQHCLRKTHRTWALASGVSEILIDRQLVPRQAQFRGLDAGPPWIGGRIACT